MNTIKVGTLSGDTKGGVSELEGPAFVGPGTI